LLATFHHVATYNNNNIVVFDFYPLFILYLNPTFQLSACKFPPDDHF